MPFEARRDINAQNDALETSLMFAALQAGILQELRGRWTLC